MISSIKKNVSNVIGYSSKDKDKDNIINNYENIGSSNSPPHNQKVIGNNANEENAAHMLNPWIRPTVLILLCFQNAGHALLARYSQGILKESYSSTEVVLVGEFMKLVFSAYVAITDRSDTEAIGSGLYKLYWLVKHSRKIIVLVIIYSIANILSYYALARVDASVYTVLLQLKIFTTAAFAVLLLGRNITSTKWRALLLLVLGCILVASPAFNTTECENDRGGSRNGKGNDNDDERVTIFGAISGIGSVLVMVCISGYSAIYFESMLKKGAEKITIWERNFQLAFYSILLLLLIIVWEVSNNEIEFDGTLFKGWTINTVLVATIQASGGLLVAATLKYADAILKTLATSGSIVLSAFLGWFLLGGQLDIFVSIGCVCTILAIFNYTLD